MGYHYVIKPYKKYLSFEDFYKLMSKIHPLNLDMWYLIYNKSLPKFKKNDVCLMKNSLNDKLKEVKIVYTYFNYKSNNYVYSYTRGPFYFKYAIENCLKISDKN